MEERAQNGNFLFFSHLRARLPTCTELPAPEGGLNPPNPNLELKANPSESDRSCISSLCRRHSEAQFFFMLFLFFPVT